MKPTKSEEEPVRCVSCNAKLKGNFCHKCGEKGVREGDFDLSKLLSDAFYAFSHWDGKHYKTIKLLFLQPGRLTQEYIIGRRKPYLKPFQVFFWCNILTFFFVGSFDVYLIPSKWFFNQNFDTFQILHLAETVAARKKLSVMELAPLYDEKVKTWSKLLLISMTPILALGSYLPALRRSPVFGKHFIFALHLLAFSLCLSLVWIELLIHLPFPFSSKLYFMGSNLIFLFYTTLSIRKFLNYSLLEAFLHALLITGLSFGLWFVYRFSVSWLTLYLL
jgi:Protein of unknown function (DUF3667)